MPPEEPGQLTVLDLAFAGEILEASIEIFEPPRDPRSGNATAWLAVSWASIVPPAGYRPAAGGVVSIEDLEGLRVTSSKGKPDDLGGGRYAWRQRAHGPGLMLVLVLPIGYTVSSMEPMAEAAKVVGSQNRIALYWMLEQREDRASLVWELEPLSGDLRDTVQSLNQRFYGIDRPAAGWVFLAEPERRPPQRAISVFVSYSHQDRDYVHQLLRYLAGLEEEGFSFWHDQRLETGVRWDDEIRRELDRADIVLALVSQDFLNSRYIKDVEVSRSLSRRRLEGLRIMPVIISPCDWESKGWLAETQVLPREAGKTLTTHFKERGERDALFLTILKELRSCGERLGGPR